jgi:hypothetical protein
MWHHITPCLEVSGSSGCVGAEQATTSQILQTQSLQCGIVVSCIVFSGSALLAEMMSESDGMPPEHSNRSWRLQL